MGRLSLQTVRRRKEKFMEVKVNTLTPELFLELYTSVGWEAPRVQQVKEALKCILSLVFALTND